MDDGVRIAVDVFLPADWSATASKADGGTAQALELPSVVHLTRYNRNFRLNKPFPQFRLWGQPPSKLANLQSGQTARELVRGGMAFVTADVRGTGASFGTRTVDTRPREIKDCRAILEWVRRQKWCNGKVGAVGAGNDGIAAANPGGARRRRRPRHPLRARRTCWEKEKN